jgi:hypothetical protein
MMSARTLRMQVVERGEFCFSGLFLSWRDTVPVSPLSELLRSPSVLVFKKDIYRRKH